MSVKRSIGTTTSRSVAAFVVGALCMMKAGRLVRVARCWSPPVSSPPLARPSTLLCFLCAAVRATGNMPRQDMANGVRRAACLYSCALLLCWQSVQNPPSAWRTAGSGLGLASASCSPRATLSGACGLVLVSDKAMRILIHDRGLMHWLVCVQVCSPFRPGFQ